MITKIEVQGYRLLNGFMADFFPLTVVIGANAVEKSSLLDCLQMIAPRRWASRWDGNGDTVINRRRAI